MIFHVLSIVANLTNRLTPIAKSAPQMSTSDCNLTNPEHQRKINTKNIELADLYFSTICVPVETAHKDFLRRHEVATSSCSFY